MTKLKLALLLSGGAATAAFAGLAAGCGDDSNAEPIPHGTTTLVSDTRLKAPRASFRTVGPIVLRERTDVARTAPRRLRGSFGVLSITVVVRAPRPSRKGRLSVACIGPGQSQTDEFLIVPDSGAYVVRERDEDGSSAFDLESRSSNPLRRQAFKLQVLCRASSGSNTLVLRVDGRLITSTSGTTGINAPPWNKIAVSVSPRSGIALENLVVRAGPGGPYCSDCGEENYLP